MKSTGMVRKVDKLGRVVIPKELLRMLDIHEGDPLEIFINGDQMILKKYIPSKACMITDEVSDDNLLLANGKVIVSPEGAKILLNDLQQLLARK